MTIFLSHKKEDSASAKRIYDFFQQKGISCYLDVLDPEAKTSEDITNLILKRLNECTHLMAVLSYKSEESWWIPFEIGAASMDGHRISTYKIDSVRPPEYLEKWPILSSHSHLEKYVSFYLQDFNISLEASSDTRVLREDKSIRTAQDFHRDMKSFIKYGF